MTTTYEEIAPGRGGTRRTLSVMRSLVERGKRDPRLVHLARRIVQGAPERDVVAELSALSDYVRQKVRFTRDPVGVETLSDAAGVLQNRAGDCDDHVVLLATLAECVGHRVRFKVGGPHADRYQHVWLEASDRRGGWLPLDPINRTANVGWEAPFPVTETLGDLPMLNLFAPRPTCRRLGSGEAPLGRPREFFPRTEDGERDPLLRSTYRPDIAPTPPYSTGFLDDLSRWIARAPWTTSRDPCEAVWSEEIAGFSGLGLIRLSSMGLICRAAFTSTD